MSPIEPLKEPLTRALQRNPQTQTQVDDLLRAPAEAENRGESSSEATGEDDAGWLGSLPIGPKLVPFGGSCLEFYKVIPKRNYFGAFG